MPDTNPRLVNRRLHRLAALVSAVPVLIVLVSGLLLQVKKEVAWVQPAEQHGSAVGQTLSFDQILRAVQATPEAGVRSWTDVERLELRPKKGLVKVVSKSRWEVQLDAGSGRVLQAAYRRSDLIESLHDGSWFHSSAKLAVFLPTALLLLGLWLTGIYLWLVPHLARRAKRLRGRRSSPTAQAVNALGS